MGRLVPLFGIVVCALAAASPVGVAAAPANIIHGCIERFDAAADYFPDKVAIADASNFSVEYRRSYKVLTLKEGYAGGPPERYVLVQCGAPVPALSEDLTGAQVISVPVRSLFALSPTHVSLLADLARLDVLGGVAQFDAVDPDLRSRIKAGRIVEFAKAGLVVDVERVVTARPSLLMTGGVLSTSIPVVRQAGVPVVSNTEWLERTALGRAEWLKYMAIFLNEERKAETLYAGMKARYEMLRAHVSAIPESGRPLIMTGRSTRGIFTIAGGQSYVAALIRDAGGRYVWADNPATGTATVDLEAQVQRAANADVWINGGGWKNVADMLADEPRYSAFKAYRERQVWVYERRVTASGANDYWSRGVTHPDLVLGDLIKIFHPSLAAGRGFEWYLRVPGE